LYEGQHHLIWRGRRELDQASVLVKTLHADPVSSPAIYEGLAQDLTREYRFTSKLAADSVLPVYDLISPDHSIALILEDPGAVPLRTLLDGDRLDRDQRVSVIRDLAAALAGVHELGVVHGAVHPGNVLVHPATERVSLTGFGVAWRLSEETPEASGVGPAREMLAYLAPEQSGRSSGAVGVQADL
jgi:serine/threonine protein kinase